MYINKDGSRVTKFSYEYIVSKNFYKDNIPKSISKIIDEEFYNTTFDSEDIQDYFNSFYRVECNIKNKITLGELWNHFKNEKFLAEKYNVMLHNCQTFTAEVVKILKAIRIHETDKVRVNEKFLLPNCIISALWHNEDYLFQLLWGEFRFLAFFMMYINALEKNLQKIRKIIINNYYDQKNFN